MPRKSSASLQAPHDLKPRDSLGWLMVGLYALFTLLPDNSSLMVAWPWVFVWQVGLALPWLWLVRQRWTQHSWPGLGYGLDYGVGLAILGLIGSTVGAQFSQQARWYAWAALCAIAALYALNEWCVNSLRRQRLLQIQGGLSFAFILTSLSLWTSQTLLPELNRLKDLRAAGLDLPYDFSVLELRNWAPIGHQNYVAGYLVLSLPLLLGLALSTRGRWRWVWGIGLGLGLVDLYTTSSRGGWLGLAVAGGAGVVLLLGYSRISSRWRWSGGLGVLALLGAIAFSNNRLRSLFSLTTADGSGSETAFRLVTNTAGWKMGLDHPLFGVGPGGVPLLYQAYRPSWAGREAELVYQLHSTPAQVFAEYGFWGIALAVGAIGFIGVWGAKLWRSTALQSGAADSETRRDRFLTWSLLAGFLGYGVVSLTDFQLDIVGISGTLIIYGAVFLSLLRDYCPATQTINLTTRLKSVWLAWGMAGLLLVVGIGLAPIHRAWHLSSLGFNALQHKQLEPFQTNLEQAHQLAPWEPYYSAQLGWHFGNLALTGQNVQGAIQQGIEFFQQNIQSSPNQEFSHSSLGWLQLASRQTTQATAAFLNATRLLPAKRGVFHSLGLSLLATGQQDLAVQAMALEILRDPLWLTSRVWRSSQLAPIYPQVQAEVIRIYQQLLQVRPLQSRTWESYLRQCLGGVYWWQGNLPEATAMWRSNNTPLNQAILAIAAHQESAQPHPLATTLPILNAWLNPQQRPQWIATALLQVNKAQPDPKVVQTILTGMNQSKSFEEWVKQKAPITDYRRERAGFGVLSRHIDGPAPFDFFPVSDNTAMTVFLAELLPSPSYSPVLDEALDPFRAKLWQSIATIKAAP